MDLATLLFPPTVADAAPGAALLAGAVRRQAALPTARLAERLTGTPAPLLAPHAGAFHLATAAALREWQGT